MGTYSGDFSHEQAVKRGFITKKEYRYIPTKYKGKRSMWFRIYDKGTKQATAYLNMGLGHLEKEAIKIFRVGSKNYKKALRVK